MKFRALLSAASLSLTAAVSAQTLATDAASGQSASAQTAYESPAAAPRYFSPRVAFGLELGANGLPGIAGVTVSYYASDRLALDAGLGVGLLAGTYGLRARGFFLDWKRMHPYAALAFKHGNGTGGSSINMQMDIDDNGTQRHYDFEAAIEPANFMDLGGGLEFRFGHFLLRPALGWSQKINGGGLNVTAGDAPTGNDRKGIEAVLGSGPTVSLGAGFGF
jgi:hypothetical protein